MRAALEHASGDYCLIQDADLEYDPEDYPALLEPLLDGSRRCGLRISICEPAAGAASSTIGTVSPIICSLPFATSFPTST